CAHRSAVFLWLFVFNLSSSPLPLLTSFYTKRIPQRGAPTPTHSCACFLVPMNSTIRPPPTTSLTQFESSSSDLTVCCRSMMWIPLRAVKMYRFILGFQRLVWCPKWTPASRSCLSVTSGMRNDLLFLLPPPSSDARTSCEATRRRQKACLMLGKV